MLLRSSRSAEAITKEAALPALALTIGRGLLGGAKALAPAAAAAGRFAVKNPMKATGLLGGAVSAGGAGIGAIKSVAGSMKKPTAQALMKRRMEGFGRKQIESIGGAQGRTFGTAVGGAQRILGG